MSDVLKDKLNAAVAARTDAKAKLELLSANTKVEKVKGNLPISLLPDSINNEIREVIDLGPDGPGLLGAEVARRGLKDLYESLRDIDDAHVGLLGPVQVIAFTPSG